MLRTQLVDRFVGGGFLHEPRWHDARSSPSLVRHTRYRLTSDRETALAAVYSDVSLSSSTDPSLMTLMLEQLARRP